MDLEGERSTSRVTGEDDFGDNSHRRSLRVPGGSVFVANLPWDVEWMELKEFMKKVHQQPCKPFCVVYIGMSYLFLLLLFNAFADVPPAH
jgi:hypothetical protein